MAHLRLIPCLLLLAGLFACSATERRDITKPGPVVEAGIAGLPPRYQPLFEALTDAVNAKEDAVARRIALGLEARLAADAARGRTAPDARRMLESFQKLLEGRRLVSLLDLELEVRPSNTPHAVALFLRARANHSEPVVLRPGGVSLRVLRVSLTPEGQEQRGVRNLSRPDLTSLALDREWTEYPLGLFATTIPGNALAARSRWSARLLAGTIVAEGETYPAQDAAVTVVERVDLAAFLPNSAIEPAELKNYLERPDPQLPALLERTVRIAPERRGEALDQITPRILAMTPEEIAWVAPCLRWLAETSGPGRDPETWRRILKTRGRTTESTGDSLDLSIGR